MKNTECEKQLRDTPQRRLVLRIVKNNYNHPTADEIYELSREEDKHISRGTVYRNLNILSELKQIQRISMPVGPDHFDLNTSNHYHFCCRSCYKVVDSNIEYKNELNESVDGLPGYKIEWHKLVLVGLCKDCFEKSEKNK